MRVSFRRCARRYALVVRRRGGRTDGGRSAASALTDGRHHRALPPKAVVSPRARPPHPAPPGPRPAGGSGANHRQHAPPRPAASPGFGIEMRPLQGVDGGAGRGGKKITHAAVFEPGRRVRPPSGAGGSGQLAARRTPAAGAYLHSTRPQNAYLPCKRVGRYAFLDGPSIDTTLLQRERGPRGGSGGRARVPRRDPFYPT